MTIGILPIGHTHGLWKELSGRWFGKGYGQLIPIVGSISVNNCAVDLTAVRGKEPKIGDVFGEGMPEEEDFDDEDEEEDNPFK